MATIANLKVILDGIENQTMGIESAIGGDIYFLLASQTIMNAIIMHDEIKNKNYQSRIS